MTKFKKGDLIEVTSHCTARLSVGEKFTVVDSRPQLSAPSFHPELVYIEVDGVVRNYSPKHFKLIEEKEVENMSRDNIVNKAGNSSGDPPSKTFKVGDFVHILTDHTGLELLNPIESRVVDIRNDVDEVFYKTYLTPKWYKSSELEAVRVSGNPPESEYLKWGDWQEGDEVVFCGFTERGHKHWSFQVGKTYIIKKDCEGLAPENDRGEIPMQDWGFKFKKVVKPTRTALHTAYVKFPDYHKTYAYILPDSIYEKIHGYKDVKLYVESKGHYKTETKVVHLVDVRVNYVDPVATKEIVGVLSAFNPQVVKISTLDDAWEINVNSHVHQGSPENIVKAHSHVHGVIRESQELREHKHQGVPPIGQTGDFLDRPYGVPYENRFDNLRLPDNMSKELADFANKFLNNKEETNMSNVTKVNRRVLNIQLLDNDVGLPVEHSLVAEFNGVVTEDSNEVTIQELISTGEVAEKLAVHNKLRAEQVDLTILQNTGQKVFLRPIKLKDLTWNYK